MGLYLVLVVTLALVQLGATVSSLPRLKDNKLDVGADTDLPNAANIDVCHSVDRIETGRWSTLSLREALSTDNFKKRPFTSGLVTKPILGGEARFKMVEIRAKRYLYALQVDPSGEKAYWLNQSVTKVEPYQYINIPEHPTADQPKYVFTADFSGCSWTVTPLGNGILRLRHVSGSQEESQFNNLPPDQKGGAVSYAMQYRDYGYTVEITHLVENREAFAYMHYSKGSWTLHLQRKACCPKIWKMEPTSAKLRDPISDIYYKKPITSTKEYIIRQP